MTHTPLLLQVWVAVQQTLVPPDPQHLPVGQQTLVPGPVGQPEVPAGHSHTQVFGFWTRPPVQVIGVHTHSPVAGTQVLPVGQVFCGPAWQTPFWHVSSVHRLLSRLHGVPFVTNWFSGH